MKRSAGEVLRAESLAEARLVCVQDRWAGYSPIAPISQDFELRLGRRDSWEPRRFSVGSGEEPGQTEVDISVPARKFFRLIASARLEHVPYWDHTDEFGFA